MTQIQQLYSASIKERNNTIVAMLNDPAYIEFKYRELSKSKQSKDPETRKRIERLNQIAREETQRRINRLAEIKKEIEQDKAKERAKANSQYNRYGVYCGPRW